MHLGARQERPERRGDHVAEPERGHAHEHDPAPRARRPAPGPAARRPPRSAGSPPPDPRKRTSTLPSASRGISRSPSQRAGHPAAESAIPSRCTARPVADGRERQARVDLAAELDDLRHAPEDPVPVRRRVHEAGGGRRRPERVEAAEHPRRSRHLREGARRDRAPQADRAEMARAIDGPVEREGVADHEGPAPERRRERRVAGRERGHPAGGRAGRRGARRRPNRAPRRGCPARWPPRPGCPPGPGDSATRSRGHGQRPPSPRLRSSTTTSATRPEGARGGDAVRRRSYTARSARARSAGRRRWSPTTAKPSARQAARSRRGDGPRPAAAPRIMAPSYPSQERQPERLTQVPRSRYRECTHHGRQ